MASKFQYSVKSLLLVAIVVALCTFVVTSLLPDLNHYFLHREVDRLVDGERYFPVQPELLPGSGIPPRLEFAQRDPVGTVQRLIGIIESDANDTASYQRRRNAINVLVSLCTQVLSPEECRDLAHELIDTTIKGDRDDGRYVPVLRACLRKVFLCEAYRIRLREHIKGQSAKVQTQWIPILTENGEEGDIELLLQLANHDDLEIRAAVYGSGLQRYNWPRLVGYIARWICKDPEEVDLLHYDVIYQTDEGRRLALSIVRDPTYVADMRRAAVSQLAKTKEGMRLVSENDEGYHMSRDGQSVLEAARHNRSMMSNFTKECCGELARELSDGVQPCGKETYARAFSFLSGDPTIMDSEAFLEWCVTNWDTVPLEKILKASLRFPCLIQHAFIMRRLFPPHDYGTIPDECRPLYHHMLQSTNVFLQMRGCDALFTFGDGMDVDAAAQVAVSLIEPPSATGEVSPTTRWAVEALKRRFAVNYFADRAAWETWLKENGWNDLE